MNRLKKIVTFLFKCWYAKTDLEGMAEVISPEIVDFHDQIYGSSKVTKSWSLRLLSMQKLQT